MKKIERIALREKLLTAIKKVIKDNKADLSSKIEKAVKKSIKQIVNKTAKKSETVATK
jgi:hypothetical protein